jgi:hypothetical protein
VTPSQTITKATRLIRTADRHGEALTKTLGQAREALGTEAWARGSRSLLAGQIAAIHACLATIHALTMTHTQLALWGDQATTKTKAGIPRNVQKTRPKAKAMTAPPATEAAA